MTTHTVAFTKSLEFKGRRVVAMHFIQALQLHFICQALSLLQVSLYERSVQIPKIELHRFKVFWKTKPCLRVSENKSLIQNKVLWESKLQENGNEFCENFFDEKK